jgi:hypothetical protein
MMHGSVEFDPSSTLPRCCLWPLARLDTRYCDAYLCVALMRQKPEGDLLKPGGSQQSKQA